MKFLSLFKKEFREILPWILLASLVFVFFSVVILQSHLYGFYHHTHKHWGPGSEIRSHELAQQLPLHDVGPLLFLVCAGLGIIMAARQFWMPGFLKTWAFTIHRSVKRTTLLRAKILAAAAGFVVSMGVLWTLLFIYAVKSNLYGYPPPLRIYIEGWVLVIMGMMTYFGAALAGLSTAKWYTSKMAGIAFAVIMFMLVFIQISLAWNFVMILIGFAILVSQIVHTFLNRQF